MKANWMMAGALAGLVCGDPAQAQPTAATGYAVERVETPAVVQGGVVRRGNAVLVGQGAFGPGLASIVRLEAGRAVTIATGFGGLGGFDLADDGTLYVVDNCYTQDFGCDGATTGDTVYAIPDALGRTTPLAAEDAELLPAGAIPFPYDVLATPLGLLVSDAVGPDAGRVVRVEESGTSDVVTGLGYTGGLAFDDPSLYVANVASDFRGEIFEFVGGSPAGALVDGLAGAAGLAVDGDGDLRVGAGGALVAVDAVGETTTLLSGLGFAGDVFHDGERDETLVLDFGTTEVLVVCADEDGDGVCDGACSDGLPLEDAKLSLKTGRREGAGSLALKAELRVDGGLFADPSEDGFAVRVLDAAGARVLDVVVPGGEGWRTKKRDRGWKWKEKTGALGVTDIAVTPVRSDDELVKIAVRNRKRSTLDPSAVALPLRAVVTLDAAGECGAGAFAACETRGGSVRCE